MVWPLIVILLVTGCAAVKNAGHMSKAEEPRSTKHWSLDCLQQGHEPRIQMKNGVVVENWQGKGSCEDEPAQEKQIQQ